MEETGWKESRSGRPLEGLVQYHPDLVSSTAMRDLEIRRALRQRLTTDFGGDPTTLIVEELGICRGTVRADMAVVNGALKGFEIKSERDNLSRLPGQASAYNKVFDTVTIVVAARHLRNVEAMVPAWWSIFRADDNGRACPDLVRIRGEGLNLDVDPFALVQLLWRDEALQAVEANGLAAGLRSKPRRYLWSALAENVKLADLRELVRMQLKSRTRWRVDQLQTRDGERSPLFAKSSNSPFQCADTHSPG